MEPDSSSNTFCNLLQMSFTNLLFTSSILFSLYNNKEMEVDSVLEKVVWKPAKTLYMIII